ncbi:MAG: hypothetical protein KJ721_03530 [Nanoarchaeota archaeon]|nr:hypothetical protein [Nanoarchaeota archaeon]
MKRGFVLGVVVCLLLLSFVNAVDTEIKINTLSNHSVNINFLNPESTSVGDLMFDTETILIGEDGEGSYTFVNEADNFDLSVFVMDRNTKVLYETFEELNSGDDITLILFPGIPKESMIELASEKVIEEIEEVDTSDENQTTEVNETEDSEFGVVGENVSIDENVSDNTNSTIDFLGFFRKVGFASSDGKGSFSNNKIYYGLGVLLLLMILFFVFRTNKLSLKKISVDGLNGDVKEKEEDLEDAEEELEKMEEKVKKLKEQKEDKIKSVKQRLIEDEKELMRLRAKKKREGLGF